MNKVCFSSLKICKKANFYTKMHLSTTKRATYKMNKLCFFTLFVDKCCKKMSLSELYLSIKPPSFKRLSIVEENCGASLMKHLNARLLLTILQKMVFGQVILSEKSQVLSNFSAFQKKIVRLSLTNAAKPVFEWVILSYKN